MKTIVPAIIAINQCELDKQLDKIKDECPLIHLDVMNYTFVQNTSLDFDFNLPNTLSKFEAHLMIDNPVDWIERNWWKVDTIIVHVETCIDLKYIINLVRNKKVKIGLAISPETQIGKLPLQTIHQLVILTVTPGYYGGIFVSTSLSKIAEAKKINQDLDIEVDGAISPTTVKLISEFDVNIFTSGSYIMNSKDPLRSMKILKDLIQ